MMLASPMRRPATQRMPNAECRRQKAQVPLPPQAAALATQSQIANRKSQILCWLLAGLLVLVTLALYWPATRCDLLVLDDTNLTPQFLKGLSWESIKWAFLDRKSTRLNSSHLGIS